MTAALEHRQEDILILKLKKRTEVIDKDKLLSCEKNKEYYYYINIVITIIFLLTERQQRIKAAGKLKSFCCKGQEILLKYKMNTAMRQKRVRKTLEEDRDIREPRP